MYCKIVPIIIMLLVLCNVADAGIYPELDFLARGRIVSVNVQNKEMILKNAVIYQGEGNGTQRNPLAVIIQKAPTLKITNAVDNPDGNGFFGVEFIHYRENPMEESNFNRAGGNTRLSDLVPGDEIWVFSNQWKKGSKIFKSETIMPITYDDEIFGVAAGGDIARLKRMLGNEELVNIFDPNGATPLHHAVVGGHGTAVNLLVEKKANVNSVKKDGVTPLHISAALGRVEIAKTLIKNGANANVIDQKGRTALSIAQKGKQTEIVKMLIGKGITNTEYGEKSSYSVEELKALFDAIGAGDLENARKMIETNRQLVNAKGTRGKFMDATLKDKYGPYDNVTPLHVAANCGQTEVIKLLLDNGANIEAEEQYLTPLCWALASNQVEAARLLISKGCRKNGEAINEAAFHGHIDAVKFLLQNGINVDEKNDIGRTSLWGAALGGYVDIVNLLIEKGANVNARAIDGGGNNRTPMSVALAVGKTEVAEILRAHGGKE